MPSMNVGMSRLSLWLIQSRELKWRHSFMCENLVHVKLSKKLEYIGESAFSFCWSLTCIFIPPLCQEICNEAFHGCTKLIILSISRNIHLGENFITKTKLSKAYLSMDQLDTDIGEEMYEWIKNINADENFELHRLCSSCNPSEEDVYSIVKRRGSLRNLQEPNSIGITPLEYLSVNPFADIDQSKLMRRFILQMMGETI